MHHREIIAAEEPANNAGNNNNPNRDGDNFTTMHSIDSSFQEALPIPLIRRLSRLLESVAAIDESIPARTHASISSIRNFPRSPVLWAGSPFRLIHSYTVSRLRPR